LSTASEIAQLELFVAGIEKIQVDNPQHVAWLLHNFATLKKIVEQLDARLTALEGGG
jgi:ubiquinone biosynthesis protein UbiJ